MSRMVPQGVIDAIRQQHDLSVEVYGIGVELCIPTNLEILEKKDVYLSPDDLVFNTYKTNVIIEWHADTARLRKLGVFTEGELPILMWVPNFYPVILKSYVKVDRQFIPREYKVNEFEVVNVKIRAGWDLEALKLYFIAPRRAYPS